MQYDKDGKPVKRTYVKDQWGNLVVRYPEQTTPATLDDALEKIVQMEGSLNFYLSDKQREIEQLKLDITNLKWELRLLQEKINTALTKNPFT